MMKRTHKGLTRLLSAGLSLALLTTLLPGAMAAVRVDDAEISYSIDSDEVQRFDLDDFEDECLEEPSDTFEYIRFTELPDSDEGTLYSDYSSSRNREEITSTRTTYDASDLDDIAFVPEKDFSGTVIIPIEGGASYGSTDYEFEGEVRIKVTRVTSSSSSDDLEYDIDVNDTLDLKYGDFDDYFDHNVQDIAFTSLPSSRDGVLYLNYGDRSEEKVEEDEVYSYKEISEMTFVPVKNYEGTVTIKFDVALEGVSRAQSGTLTINVGDGRSSSVSAKTGDVTVYTDTNKSVYLDVADFDDFVYEDTDDSDEVSYLMFTSLPDKDEGVLWYEDISDDRKVDEDESFDHDDIDYVYFVPDDDFEGPVTIPFEGRSNNRETFKGDLVINVGVSDEAEVTVELQGATGSPLTFQAADFNDACLDATGSNLNYVEFDFTSGRGGYLYYKYDEGYEDEVGSARYYRSASPSLDDVTFVPGSATGSTVRIPFEGCSTNNKRFSGEVEIHLVALQSPGVVRYTSDGTAVRFKASDFSAACAARGGESLVSVQFTVPDTTGGQLYYNFTSPAKYRGVVVSSITYSVSGLYMLDLVSFLPRAEYTGTITIPYVGTDAAGITFNGTVEVTVNSPTATTRFNDMANYSWAVPGVEFMAAYGITTGTGNGSTFSPGDKLTRGDYVLMLVRAFGFTSTSTANFNDVPADSWYTEALAIARAQGIIEADANGNFRPTEPVTREDSMLYLYRAMQKSGRTIANAYDTYLSRYPDGASVSDYARSAMAALTQAGIIQGDQAGRLNPQNTLTRAEMAVILHRGLTM